MLVLRDAAEAVAPVLAPHGKAGRLAGSHVMFDEGRGDYADWTGPWFGTRIVSGNPISGSVTETTVNLVERFGAEFPENVGVALARFATGQNGALIAQAPAAVTANGDVEDDELFAFELVVPEIRPADNRPPTDGGVTPGRDAGTSSPNDDFDADGVADGLDNCLETPNPAQSDLDEDGRGDACDRCPTTAPGARIDAFGCETTGRRTPGSAFDNKDDPNANGCGCNAAERSTSSSAAWLLLLIVPFVRLRKKHLAVLLTFVFVGCGSFTGSDDDVGGGPTAWSPAC